AWSVEAVFFEMWLEQHPDADLAQVPADLVMTSGSGLDPHISVANARYQLDRVVPACAKKYKLAEADVRKALDELLDTHAASPLGGLAGVPLLNVLELNAALADRMQRLQPTAK